MRAGVPAIAIGLALLALEGCTTPTVSSTTMVPSTVVARSDTVTCKPGPDCETAHFGYSDNFGATSGQAFASGEGIAYFLPRQLARVSIKQTETKMAELVGKLAAARLAWSATDAQVAGARKALDELDQQIVASRGVASVLALLESKRPAALKSVEDAVGAQTKAKGEYDKLAAQLTSAKLADEAADGTAAPVHAAAASAADAAVVKIDLKIELLEPSADPRFGFRLDPRHQIQRDDEHKIVVNRKGLLTSTDIVSADRSTDIAVELSKTAGAIAALVKSGDERASASCPVIARSDFVGVVDFADPADIRSLNDKIACLGVRLDAMVPVAPQQQVGFDGVDGIVYRTPIDVVVLVEKCNFVKTKNGTFTCQPDTWGPSEMLALSLPQAGPISYLRQDAGALTKTEYKVAFDNGILTSYDAKRPSELVMAAGTPMRMLDGFFEGVSKVISLRTGQNEAQQALTDSEKNLLLAQYALLASDMTGQGTVLTEQQKLVQLQNGLALLGITSQTTSAGSQTELLNALLQLQATQAKQNEVEQCVGARILEGKTYTECFE